MTNRYIRPQPKRRLAPEEKSALVREYLAFYQALARESPEQLNVKIPREAFSELVNVVGTTLLEASRAASECGPVHDFLDANPLPDQMRELLPNEFRAFCLALNAIKQWVAAEQAAADRYLLGGRARADLVCATEVCLVTGKPFVDKPELHHPLRDGRPPIPVSAEGHALIEGQVTVSQDDPVHKTLVVLKQRGNRSWVQLRRGCEDLLGRETNHTTENVGGSSRTFARQASQATDLSYAELLAWLDGRQL